VASAIIIVGVDESMKKLTNPYPEDIFSEPEKWEKERLLHTATEEHIILDSHFGSFGRKVWNNTIEDVRKVVEEELEEFEKKHIDVCPDGYPKIYGYTEEDYQDFKKNLIERLGG